MNVGVGPAPAAACCDLEWAFGAYPYGLEPLFLPEAIEPSDPPAGESGPLLVDGLRDRVQLPVSRCAARGEAMPSRDDVFWFRWITGHQVTFVVWRLMGRLLRRAPATGLPPREAVHALARLTDGYTAMLLYTSSCTGEAYERFIRPSMYRHHHGFSGSWAPDYRAVRSLFHGRRLDWVDQAAAADLRAAVAVNHLVHSGIAARLVPGSPSLLQKSGTTTRTQDRFTLGVVFDEFFLTVRSYVDEDLVHDQLVRRLAAVLHDVDRNGLYPEGEDLPDEYRVGSAGDAKRRFHETAAALAALSREV